MHVRVVLPLLLVLPLAAQAQPTRELAGQYRLEVLSGDGAGLPAEVQLEPGRPQRLRLTLDGYEGRLARVGSHLFGRLRRPATPSGGLAGAVGEGRDGGAAAVGSEVMTVRLEVLADHRLQGSLHTRRGQVELRLRKLSLEEAARRLVVAHASTDEEDRFLPGVEWGEEGLQACVLDGPAARRALRFAVEWQRPDPLQGLPRREGEVVIAVRSTDDEEELYLLLMDRVSGVGRPLCRLPVVDLALHLDQATLDGLVPGMGPIDEVDHYRLIDRLVEGGAPVDLRAAAPDGPAR